MKVPFTLKLLLIVAASLAVTACGKLEYDWKGLLKLKVVGQLYAALIAAEDTNSNTLLF